MQAAIGSLALDTARSKEASEDQISLGIQVFRTLLSYKLYELTMLGIQVFRALVSYQL